MGLDCKYLPGNKSSSVGHIRGKWGLVVVTLGICPLSSVKQIFHAGKPARDDVSKTYEGMISTKSLGTLDLIAAL